MQIVRDLLVNLGLVLSGVVVGILISYIFLEHMRGELTKLEKYADSVKAKYIAKEIGKEKDGGEDENN